MISCSKVFLSLQIDKEIFDKFDNSLVKNLCSTKDTKKRVKR